MRGMDFFEVVIQKAVFAAAVETHNRKAMGADLVDSHLLAGAFDAHALTNVQIFTVHHLTSPA
jgi:hypothetical protein